jgi:hypothetical protein
VKKIFLIIFVISSIITLSCDHGINPDEWMDPGFGGKITFIGKWPPQDSVKDLRLVVYKKYPPPIFFDFTKFSDQLPYGVSSAEYKMPVTPGEYDYIVVAQQYGPNIFLHWKAVGFYSSTVNKDYPGSLIIEEGKFIKNIDITVDFDHLPVQPFLYK